MALRLLIIPILGKVKLPSGEFQGVSSFLITKAEENREARKCGDN